jgi:hypothetical protein
MATSSPRLYRERKKRIFDRYNPISFATATFSYNFRPHRTLPELREYIPNPWVPSYSSSSSSSGILICEWDSPEAVWGDTFAFDCED